MEAGSRAVHALTQLRILEQALRGKRARPSKEVQFVKTYHLESEENITPVVLTDGIKIQRSRNRWKASRTTEKLANWDHQIQMMMAPLVRQTPSSGRATFRMEVCRSTGTLQSAQRSGASQIPSHSHPGHSILWRPKNATAARGCWRTRRGEHTRS